MALPPCRTKILCTIGPASQSPRVIEQMIQAGMSAARLNFSHGDLDDHLVTLAHIRAAERSTGRRVAILADLPGPKVRIGMLKDEPVELRAGDTFTLTTEGLYGDSHRASVSLPGLPQVVTAGDALFLNDGFIELQVQQVEGQEVHCVVRTGGELRSRKGLNLPGIDLGIRAFTDEDRRCLEFALEQGVDAVSQSFVGSAADLRALREAAKPFGNPPFVIAKVERARALAHYEEILDEADGIMVARGDLGVETPIEKMAIVQKDLIARAVARGKTVITATQMLESMTHHRLPTRAEATDVANAILDGTDCLMLSGESAVGDFPVEAVAMLVRIAAATEPQGARWRPGGYREPAPTAGEAGPRDLVALAVEDLCDDVTPATVLVPTVSGATARSVARFRLPVWVTAVSPSQSTCRELQLSYGILPVHEAAYPDGWNEYARQWVKSQGLEGDIVVLVEGPSSRNREANHRMEIITLG